MVDYREWLEKAKVFLEEAIDDLDRGRYWLACFHAQQHAELVLKAVLLRLAGSYPFTHSLVELLEAVEALGYEVGEEVYLAAEALEKHYTRARYPGLGLALYDRRVGERCVRLAREISRYAQEILERAEERARGEA